MCIHFQIVLVVRICGKGFYKSEKASFPDTFGGEAHVQRFQDTRVSGVFSNTKEAMVAGSVIESLKVRGETRGTVGL